MAQSSFVYQIVDKLFAEGHTYETIAAYLRVIAVDPADILDILGYFKHMYKEQRPGEISGTIDIAKVMTGDIDDDCYHGMGSVSRASYGQKELEQKGSSIPESSVKAALRLASEDNGLPSVQMEIKEESNRSIVSGSDRLYNILGEMTDVQYEDGRLVLEQKVERGDVRSFHDMILKEMSTRGLVQYSTDLKFESELSIDGIPVDVDLDYQGDDLRRLALEDGGLKNIREPYIDILKQRGYDERSRGRKLNFTSEEDGIKVRFLDDLIIIERLDK